MQFGSGLQKADLHQWQKMIDTAFLHNTAYTYQTPMHCCDRIMNHVSHHQVPLPPSSARETAAFLNFSWDSCSERVMEE